jgi:hypothetical protein
MMSRRQSINSKNKDDTYNKLLVCINKNDDMNKNKYIYLNPNCVCLSSVPQWRVSHVAYNSNEYYYEWTNICYPNGQQLVKLN